MRFDDQNMKDGSEDQETELFFVNLKDKLDESLDLANVTVSEELIGKTLQAIKMQSSSDSTGRNNEATQTKGLDRPKKASEEKVIEVRHFIRRVGSIAAALLILVVCIQVARGMFDGFGASKEDSARMEFSAEDSNKADSGAKGSIGMEEPTDEYVYDMAVKQADGVKSDAADAKEITSVTNAATLTSEEEKENVTYIAESDYDTLEIVVKQEEEPEVYDQLIELSAAFELVEITEPLSDVWQYIINLTRSNQSTTMYYVGKIGYVNVVTYDETGLPTNSYYEISDTINFISALREIIEKR